MTGSVGKGATIGFLLAIAVLLASTWLTYRNISQIFEDEQLVIHTHRVLEAIQETLVMATEAETAQRGYLITGDTAYLAPYEAALAALPERQRRIEALTADHPSQRRRALALARQISIRLGTLREGILARTGEGAEAAQRFIQAGKGKQEMDTLRSMVAEMQREESQLLAARQGESRSGYLTATVTLLISALLGLGLVGAAYVLAVREAGARREAAEGLKRVNDMLEDRVRERTAELQAAVESLRLSNRELEQFASVASHDLEEPLRKIQAFGDRLQAKHAEALGAQGRDYLDRMQASAVRMRTLIEALLTYSRVTTKAQPFIPVDVGALMREVVADLEGRLAQNGGKVELGALPTIDADPVQLRQLMQNLVGNGLKFHRPGVPPRVRVEGRLLDDGERCEITVQDDGIGFEEVYLDRIFEVFQRLHGRQEYEGTGMGLAICRRIVERHGGTISATSAPDRGATFIVTLPVRQLREDT